MGAIRTALALILSLVVSACAEPGPRPDPSTLTTQDPLDSVEVEASAAETPAASPGESMTSCWVTTPRGETADRFITPERALAAFAEVWREHAADPDSDEHTRVLAETIVDTAARARFTLRTDTEVTAEAPHRGDVATYYFRKDPEGWAWDGLSLPLPMTSCGAR